MTIQVSLTNARHIAAATKLYEATIPVQSDPTADPLPAPYASVDEYVQAALNLVADSWVETTKVDVISVGDFVLRFTGAEYTAITSSTDPNVIGILAILRARDNVRLGSPDAISGIGYLVSAGYLTAERGAAVLAY